MFLEVLQQHPAGAVNNSFGRARGAGSIEDVGRVIERHRREFQIGLLAELVLAYGVQGRVDRAFAADDQRRHGRQLAHDDADAVRYVVSLSAIPVVRGGEEHLWFHLPDAVDDRRLTEIRRARCPGSTHRKCRQQRHECIDIVRLHARDTIPGLHSGRSQALRHSGYFGLQFTARQRPNLPQFVHRQDRLGRVVAAQQVLGEIQTRVREELCAGHPSGVIGLKTNLALVANHRAEIPDRRPELPLPVDGPAMQGVIIHRVKAVEFGETPQGRGLFLGLGGGPQDAVIVRRIHRCHADLPSVQLHTDINSAKSRTLVFAWMPDNRILRRPCRIVSIGR